MRQNWEKLQGEAVHEVKAKMKARLSVQTLQVFKCGKKRSVSEH